MAKKAVADEAEKGGSVEDKLIESLLKEIKVDKSQSSVIRVSFSSPDPRFSADVVNAFAKAYIDTMLELRVEPTRDAATWFDEQLKTLRTHLEDAQTKLTDYHQRRGIVSADERVDDESTRLVVLSDQVARAQEQTFQWKSRVQQGREFLEHSGSPDKLPDILDNPSARAEGELLHGEAKRRNWARTTGPITRSTRSVAETEPSRETRRRNEKASRYREFGRQSRQRGRLPESNGGARVRVLDLKEGRNELTGSGAMWSRRARLRHRYAALVESQIDSRASQTNVTVLNPAVAPRKHSRPKITLNIALSVVVGTMLGIGVVLLMEMFDRRVRSRSDLDLDVPLLAVVNAWQPGGVRRLGRSGGNRQALPNPAEEKS